MKLYSVTRGGMQRQENEGKTGAHAHEVLEVVVVVEGLLGLAADGKDGLHGLHGVLPPQRLRAQQDAIHAIQHCVRHVRRLSPAHSMRTGL